MIIGNIYKNATVQVKIDEDTKTEKNNVIFSKLLKPVLEDGFEKLNWEEKSEKVGGQLHSVDDIVLISSELAALEQELL